MQRGETAYVQTFSLALEPFCILTNNQQLNELVKFCTNPLKFSVFQVDPTFNLGNFSVTTTTNEHLFLRDRRTGKAPSLLGLVYIHQKKGKNFIPDIH